MLSNKLFLIASLGLVALTNAQETSTFQFKDTYPEPYKVPQPKKEWLDLIANASIADAPLLKTDANGGLVLPENPENDPHCLWTTTQCLDKEDVYTCPTTGEWGVTFDDGPSEFSPALYDYLDKKNEKVTFYMVGGQVKQFPELLKRAYDAGHEIAMHTWSHSYMTTLTNEELVAELKWTEQIIKEVIGVSPKYYRPPFGNIDNRVRDIGKALGFTPVIWSVDTNDWYLPSDPTFQAQWITNNVTEWASKNTTQGGVSLAHDLYKETVDAALNYLPILEDAYDLKTVAQCNSQNAYKEGKGTAAGGNNTTQPSASSSAGASGSASESSKPSSEAGGDKKENAEKDSATKGQEDDESAASTLVMSATSMLLVLAAAALSA